MHACISCPASSYLPDLITIISKMWWRVKIMMLLIIKFLQPPQDPDLKQTSVCLLPVLWQTKFHIHKKCHKPLPFYVILRVFHVASYERIAPSRIWHQFSSSSQENETLDDPSHGHSSICLWPCPEFLQTSFMSSFITRGFMRFVFVILGENAFWWAGFLAFQTYLLFPSWRQRSNRQTWFSYV